MADENLNESEEIEMDAVADQVEESAETVDETPPEPTIEEKLAAAEAKAAENLEGWQRARAEFDNARKRFQKGRLEARTNAMVNIAEQLLPVLDDFDLAFGNVPDEVAESEWFGGLELIPRKMFGILEKIGIERVGSVGEAFDPNFHNAIMREDSAEYETDTVIREFQGGYKIGDRVIRPAIVVVAS